MNCDGAEDYGGVGHLNLRFEYSVNTSFGLFLISTYCLYTRAKLHWLKYQ